MITGIVKRTIERADVNYRQLPELNYSMIKLWDDNPTAFFEQFKLGQKRKEKRSVSKIIGDLAHFFVLDCKGNEEEFDQKFDEKFAKAEGDKGSGQVFLLCDYIFENLELDENRKPVNLEGAFMLAYDRIKKEDKYKGKNEDVVYKDFETNGMTYFTTLMSNVGKTVVFENEIQKAKQVGNLLRNDAHVYDIFFDGGEAYRSFPILWSYESESIKIACKSELDKFKINDRKKIIKPYDLKFTWDNESFPYSYLSYKYYIQQAFYYMAMVWYFSEVEEQYADYEIQPMEYIVGDTSSSVRRPLVYPCDLTDLKYGLEGFSVRGKRHKGVHELLQEIHWADTNGIWDISKEAHANKGVMKLDIPYE